MEVDGERKLGKRSGGGELEVVIGGAGNAGREKSGGGGYKLET